jgi:hypothetical protein
MAITLDGSTGITTPLVEGGAIATQAEAEAGTNNTKLMTPLRVEQNFNQNLASSRYIANVGTAGGFNSNSGFVSATRLSEGRYRLIHPNTGGPMQYVSTTVRQASSPRWCLITIESDTSILFEWTLISSGAAQDTSFWVEVQPVT